MEGSAKHFFCPEERSKAPCAPWGCGLACLRVRFTKVHVFLRFEIISILPIMA